MGACVNAPMIAVANFADAPNKFFYDYYVRLLLAFSLPMCVDTHVVGVSAVWVAPGDLMCRCCFCCCNTGGSHRGEHVENSGRPETWRTSNSWPSGVSRFQYLHLSHSCLSVVCPRHVWLCALGTFVVDHSNFLPLLPTQSGRKVAMPAGGKTTLLEKPPGPYCRPDL